MLSLSKLWKISGIFYRELAFKSLLNMRRPGASNEAIKKLIDNSIISITINKIFITLIFIIAMLFAGVENSPISYASYILMVMFMFAVFFLQSVTYYFQVDFDILNSLPINRRGRERIMLLTFLRIFDMPLATNLLLFPVVAGFAAGPLSVLPAIIGILSAEIFAIALVTYLSAIFYRKLASPSSGWRAAVRFIFILIWGTSFFVLYAVMIWMPTIYHYMKNLSPILNDFEFLFRAIFPFDFSYLIVDPDPISLLSSALFTILAYFAFKWTLHTGGRKPTIEYMEMPEMKLKIHTPIGAMFRKDLKITTRNPGLAMLLALPALEVLLLMSMNVRGIALISVLVTFIIIYLYSLFGFENFELIKTLPVTRGFVYISKNVLSISLFIVTLLVMNIYSFFTGVFISPLWQVLSSIGVFSSGLIILYMGDAMGLRASVGLSALGFILLIAVGNVITLFPILLEKILPGLLGVVVSVGVALSIFLLSVLAVRKSSF